MKIFKRVYYPIMAALVVLMLVLGMVDSRVGMSGGNLADAQVDGAYAHAQRIASADSDENNVPHNTIYSDEQNAVREYIESVLIEAGAKNVMPNNGIDDIDDDGFNTADYVMDGEDAQPSLYRQTAKVKGDSQSGSEIAVEYEVKNIILAIPGTSGDAILLYAPYDSSYLGGASDAAATGALLQTAANMLEKGTAPKNTVVFLFGDAGKDGDIGACAFINQFVGFDNVVDNIRTVADFRVAGTGGTLMVYGDSDGSLEVVGKYASVNGSAYMSSAVKTFTDGSAYESTGVFGDYNSLVFTNRGGFNEYATARDTQIDKSLVSQNANAMAKFADCFMNANLGKMDSDYNAVYFPYLDVVTVSYSTAIAYVIAAIIAALTIAVAIVNMRTRAFSLGKALAGAALQIVAILGSMLVMLALYYLFALLLCGFGVLPFQGLSSVLFAGGGLFVSAIIMAVAIAIAFYIILKRTFAVKAGDVVRGNTLLFAVVAFIVSFAAPSISYPLTCVALFSLVAMLMTAIFKNRFKAKFGMDMDRLFLYVWAIVFSLPLVVPVMFVASTVYPLLSIVVIMAVMIALSGFVAPYADYLKPVLDKAFKKLPMRTVRFERTVTEMVEDRAKKGKFTEVTKKQIVKEKVAWNYLNRIGLVTVAVIAAVMIMLFGSFGTAFSSSALDAPSYFDSIYNDSLLYVYDGSSVTVEVHDRIAYEYIRYAVDGLEWDSDKNAYVKDYNGRTEDIIPTMPIIGDKSGDAVSFSTFDLALSQITITLEDASAVKKVSFGTSSNKIEYEFENQETITLRLPYGYNLNTMNVDGSCRIEFEQHIYDDKNLPPDEAEDWQKLYSYGRTNADMGMTPHSGIVIKLTKSI